MSRSAFEHVDRVAGTEGAGENLRARLFQDREVTIGLPLSASLRGLRRIDL